MLDNGKYEGNYGVEHVPKLDVFVYQVEDLESTTPNKVESYPMDLIGSHRFRQ